MRIIILALLLTGCTPAQINKTADYERIYLKWPLSNRTWLAVRTHCGDTARACVIGDNLYAEEPRDAEDYDQMRVLGHEALHSAFDAPGGNWHEDKR